MNEKISRIEELCAENRVRNMNAGALSQYDVYELRARLEQCRSCASYVPFGERYHYCSVERDKSC